MKKIIIVACTVMMMLGVSSPSAHAGKDSGGFTKFLVGCCFGPRSAADFNEGKELHINEWGRLIPIANIYFMIVSGLDGKDGLTTSDLAKKYGSTFY